ncbi:MAG: BglG family transcription antiterminator, partial [Coriobacteriales bacterium]
MDKRLETLIEYIQEHQPVPYSQTADYMGISQRTLRNWVRSANSSLSDVVEIASKRGEGYLLKIHDQQAFQQLMSSPGSSSESTRLPSSPEERQDYLLNDLLWRDDWITIDELASVLYVSRRTTSKDLAVVEKTLSNYGLSLVSRPYSGIKVVGSEQSRRICLASVVASKLSFGSEQDLHPLVSCVSEALSEALDASDLSISLLSYQNLVVHLTVAVRRIQTGRY